MGDRDGVERLYTATVTDASWTKQNHASATAFLNGIAEAQDDFEEALEARRAEVPPPTQSCVVIAAVLRRRDEVADLIQAAQSRTGPSTELEFCRLVERFSFDDAVTIADVFREGLELCDTPAEVKTLHHITLPLLAAARARTAAPVPPVEVDQDILERRLQAFADTRARAAAELERRADGLSSLATLADPDAGVEALVAAQRNAQAHLPDDLPESVRAHFGSMLTRRAAAGLPSRLLAARLGDPSAVDDRDVLAAVDPDVDVPGPQQLVIALLAGTLTDDRLAEVAARAGDGNVVPAVEEFRQVLQARVVDGTAYASAPQTVRDLWAVAALLEEAESRPGCRRSCGARRTARARRSASASTRSSACCRVSRCCRWSSRSSSRSATASFRRWTRARMTATSSTSCCLRCVSASPQAPASSPRESGCAATPDSRPTGTRSRSTKWSS